MSNEYIDWVEGQIKELEAASKHQQFTLFPADGSLRDYASYDRKEYVIEEYRFGVWNVILRTPVDPAVTLRLEKFLETSSVFAALEKEQTERELNPDTVWPFPAPQETDNQSTVDKEPVPVQQSWPFPMPDGQQVQTVDPYDHAMDIVRKG